jgi:hypothetical protein
MKEIAKSDIIIGDILFIDNVMVNGNIIGERPFLVWDKDFRSSTKLMLYEISSKDKAGQEYPYNVPIIKSSINGLAKDSHIKADKLFIYCETIILPRVIKFGELEYEKYGSEILNRTNQAVNNHEYYFFDQSNNGKQLIGW